MSRHLRRNIFNTSGLLFQEYAALSVVLNLTSFLPFSAVPKDEASLTRPSRLKTALSSKTVQQTPTPEPTDVPTVENVTLHAKNVQHTLPESSSGDSSESSGTLAPDGIVQRCIDSMASLEKFWFNYNKVEIDYLEIGEEKRSLQRENKELRGMIRAVLEAAALSKSIPSSKVSTRLPSRRSAISAPLRRIVLS